MIIMRINTNHTVGATVDIISKVLVAILVEILTPTLVVGMGVVILLVGTVGTRQPSVDRGSNSIGTGYIKDPISIQSPIPSDKRKPIMTPYKRRRAMYSN